MKRLNRKHALISSVLMLILIGLSGCAKTTPPGASFVYGALVVPEGTGGSFTVLQWKDGPTVALVDDLDGADQSSGSATAGDPTWRGEGSALDADGRHLNWRVETTDGVTEAIFINSQKYDLERGNLFLIRTSSDHTTVVQYKRDSLGPCADYDACHTLLVNDPAVMQYIQDTLAP